VENTATKKQDGSALLFDQAPRSCLFI